MSRDRLDKALDSTNLLKHHDIYVDMLSYKINHKLYESEHWDKYFGGFHSIIFRILTSEVEILMNLILRLCGH